MNNTVPIVYDAKSLQLSDNGEICSTFSWSKAKTYQVSKEYMVVAKTYAKTQSYNACREQLKLELKKSVDLDRIKDLLGYDEVKELIVDLWEEAGVFNAWSKARWVKIMTDHVLGNVKLNSGQVYSMKLIADVLGYGEVSPLQQNAININIVQKDGQE